MRILILSIAMLILLPAAYSQKQIVLVKKNKVMLRISEGEFIRFRTKKEKEFTKGFITGIHQEFFRIGNDTTYFYNIAAVDLHGRPASSLLTSHTGITLIVAGTILLLADAANSNDVGSGILAVSGAFITAGLTLQFFNNDIFKIGRKKKVISMGL